MIMSIFQDSIPSSRCVWRLKFSFQFVWKSVRLSNFITELSPLLCLKDLKIQLALLGCTIHFWNSESSSLLMYELNYIFQSYLCSISPVPVRTSQNKKGSVYILSLSTSITKFWPLQIFGKVTYRNYIIDSHYFRWKKICLDILCTNKCKNIWSSNSLDLQ